VNRHLAEHGWMDSQDRDQPREACVSMSGPELYVHLCAVTDRLETASL